MSARSLHLNEIGRATVKLDTRIPFEAYDDGKIMGAFVLIDRYRHATARAGKSTLANAAKKALNKRGVHTYMLDGDNVRQGLNKDHDFTDAARIESTRRIAKMAKIMADAGLVVMTNFISPFRSERDIARSLFDEDDVIEVFVDTPLNLAEQSYWRGSRMCGTAQPRYHHLESQLMLLCFCTLLKVASF
ncbi:MAG: bifunctional enzyme CysN/CysC [Candidatus Azotimanducaceae bacterium]|jgi:bifunctional enzyme CysN/CysC